MSKHKHDVNWGDLEAESEERASSFQYGFDASYYDVLTRIEEPFIARTIPLTRFPDPPAMTQVIVADLAQPIGRSSYISTVLGPELLLTLEVDGQPVYRAIVDTAERLTANSTPFYFEHEMTPGDHQLRLALEDDVSDITFVLFDEKVPLQAGQTFRYGN